MLTYAILIPVMLFIYWLMWVVYMLVVPHFTSMETPEILRAPKFWQFAAAIFVITLLLTKVNSK
jgi:hypothetical protein